MNLESWAGMRLNCHQDFQKMFTMCYRYTDLSNSLRILKDDVDGYLIAEVQILSLAIIEEYKKVLDANYPDSDKKEALISKVQNDILVTISGWFDKSDKTIRLRNLSNDFLNPIRNEMMDMYLPLFKATIDSFINSRIKIVYEEAVLFCAKDLPVIFESFLSGGIDEEFFGELEDWHVLMQKFRNHKVALLCEDCNSFQQFLENLYKRAPLVSSDDVNDFAGYFQRITMDLALFTNKKVEVFNFMKGFVESFETLQFNSKMLRTQVLLSKIYYSLLKAFDELKSRELERFVLISANKVGLFPLFVTEKTGLKFGDDKKKAGKTSGGIDIPGLSFEGGDFIDL